jgi:hypothetical protein
MPARKKLIACKIFADELLTLGAIPEGTEVTWIEAALHEDYKMLEEQIRAALSDVDKGQDEVHLLFGGDFIYIRMTAAAKQQDDSRCQTRGVLRPDPCLRPTARP